MATLSTVISYGEPTGTIVTEIGTPGPTGQTGPQGPAGPTFTGGPITSPITYDAGTNSTAFENGDVFAQDNTSGSYGAIYTGGLQASNGDLTIDITGAGITFGDATFQSTAFPGSSAFYPSTGNPSGFLTAASLSGYATQSWVTSQGYVTQSYVNGQGFITASALTPYLLSSTAASTYQTISGMSAYLQKAGGYITGDIQSNNNSAFRSYNGSTKTSVLNSNYLQLNTSGGGGVALTIESSGITFPSGKQTVHYPGLSILSGYATESWVTAGFYPLTGNPSAFLTDAPSDGSQYARQDGAWEVVTGGGGSFNGGAVANPITISDGTNDSEMAAAFFGVELTGDTTQNAYLQYNALYVSNPEAGTQIGPGFALYNDSTSSGSIGSSMDYAGISVFNGTTSAAVTPTQISVTDTSGGSLHVNSTGIQFPDSSVQSSAAFVPGSGNLDMAGYDITNANFNSSAGQVSAQNVSLSSGGSITFGDSTVQTTAYTGGGGGGLPVVQIAASAINPSHISTDAAFPPLTYPTHTDILNGSYVTSFTYSGDAVGNPALILSGLTSLNTANVSGNTLMTSAPDFSGCTALYTANVSSNAAMTSAPDFSGLTALYNAYVYSNPSMTSAPSFSGCTFLNTANVNSNASMTSAPSFSGCTSLNTAYVYSNPSMTSAPSFSG